MTRLAGRILSAEDRPGLPDPRDEEILCEAEERVFLALQLGGLSARQARVVLIDLGRSAQLRLAMQVVCEFTPSR